jgi:hypothetical protein
LFLSSYSRYICTLAYLKYADCILKYIMLRLNYSYIRSKLFEKPIYDDNNGILLLSLVNAKFYALGEALELLSQLETTLQIIDEGRSIHLG